MYTKLRICLNCVSWLFILFGFAAVLVDRYVPSDTHVQYVNYTVYGILLIAGGVSLLFRLEIGWWWLAGNSVYLVTVIFYVFYIYRDPFGGIEKAQIPWSVPCLITMFSTSAVLLFVFHPWRWQKSTHNGESVQPDSRA